MNYTTQTKLVQEGAHFESREIFNSHCTVVESTSDRINHCGLPLDYISENRYATSADEHHVLIVGDTGCGKTRRLIVPTIRLLGKTGQSMVVSDPKGELYQKTSADLRNKGYDVKVFNMRNPRRGIRWNPFSIIQKMIRSGNQEDADKADVLIENILNTMKTVVHSDKDAFWENLSTQLLIAITQTIGKYGPDGTLSFGSIAAAESDLMFWAREMNPDDGFDEDSMFEKFKKFVEMAPESIRQNYASFLDAIQEPKMLSSIGSVTHVMANYYCRQDVLRFLLSESDFDIKDIGRKPTVLYMILPDENEVMYPLATIFVDQVYTQMIELAYEEGGKLPNPVNFVLDEFANFTRLPNFKSMLTASRSRGMRFFLVVQDVDQLETQYSINDAAIIRSNCLDWVYMGCRNVEFLRMLVEISGMHYDRYTGEGRMLIQINDLLTLQMGEAFVWTRGCNPKKCWFPDYSEVDFGNSDTREDDFPPRNEAETPAVVSFRNVLENVVSMIRTEEACSLYRSFEDKSDVDILF